MKEEKNESKLKKFSKDCIKLGKAITVIVWDIIIILIIYVIYKILK